MTKFGTNLEELRKEKGLNQDELADKVGISRATLSDYERGKTEPRFSTLLKISKFFGITTDTLLGNLITDRLNQKKGNVKGNLIGNPLVNEPATDYGNRIPKVVTVDSQGRDNVVLVPIRARAGYLAGYEDPEYIQSLPTYNMPGMANGTFRAFEIFGHSMVPTFQESDIIFGRYVENFNELRDDRVYVIVTKQEGIVVKRVINRVHIENKLVLNSDNQRHLGEYPPIIIEPEDILEIWYGISYYSRQMRSPRDVYNRLNDLEARLTLIEGRPTKSLK